MDKERTTEPNIRQTHIFNRKIIPFAPLRDHQKASVITSNEREEILAKSFELFVSGNISISDRARIRSTFDPECPQITPSEQNNSHLTPKSQTELEIPQ